MNATARLVTTADELEEGLFGQVFLYIFEVLPYLDRHNVRPDWRIHARHYGGEEQTVIPGVLDLAYIPGPVSRDVALAELRRRHCAQLGNDWSDLHRIWTRFFRLPQAVESRAEGVGPLNDALGVHYRGTDKLTADWDTNPVAAEDMIAIIADFLGRRPDLTRIFLATDDRNFPAKLRSAVGCDVINLGEVSFHKAEDRISSDLEGATRALLDSVLLSRCGAVLKTSSALSGFAKIFNPQLEIYRCAASKRFADIPYFPVAYIPPYQSEDAAVQAILTRLMRDDWQQSDPTPPRRFTARARRPYRTLAWKMVEAVAGSPIR